MSNVPPAIRGRSSRRRGNNGELQVVQILKAFGWINARRNLEQTRDGGRDILSGPEGTCIEVKFTERLKLREAYKQCCAAAGPDVPVVIHRCNNEPWLATLELEELLPLLKLRES